MNTATHGGTGGDPRGATVLCRLHRMVRHGYRPWLGYDVASGADRDVKLHRSDGVATLLPDGSVVLPASTKVAGAGTTIAGDDHAAFDRAFPPDTPNKRNIVRRLYEIGFPPWLQH